MAKCRECGYGSRMGTFRIAFFGAVLAASGLGWACSATPVTEAPRDSAAPPVGSGPTDAGRDALDSAVLADAADGSDGAPIVPPGWCGIPPENSVPAASVGFAWDGENACPANTCNGVSSRQYRTRSGPFGELLRPSRVQGCKHLRTEGDYTRWCCPVACMTVGPTDRCNAILTDASTSRVFEYQCPQGIKLDPADGCAVEPSGFPSGVVTHCCPE